MWGVISTVFLGLYCLMGFYIGRRGWTTLGKSSSRFSKGAFLFILLILFLFYPASGMLRNILPNSMGLSINIWGWYSMIAVSYIFLLVLILDIIRLIDRGTGFVPRVIKEHKKTPLALGTLVIISVISILAYGGWNARNPVVTEYELSVNKKAGSIEQLKVAMVSDIHYGPIVNAERLETMVNTINKLQPDIILLPGDIVEGSAVGEEAKKLSNALGSLQAKYGKYAVTGNHDRGLRDDNSELSRSFKEAGVDILRDNYLKVQDSFYVIGRNDGGWGNGRKIGIEEIIKGIDDSLPKILLDHQPVDLKQAQDNGIDLQVSGHTHMGQIFPLHLVTGQIYDLDWGLLNKENYHLIVSSGYGTWGPPLRIGTSSEIVSITLKFNK